jgi:hypothetical protein
MTASIPSANSVALTRETHEPFERTTVARGVDVDPGSPARADVR